MGVKTALRHSTPLYVPDHDDRPAPAEAPIALGGPPHSLPPRVAAALADTESLEVYLVGRRPRPKDVPEGEPVPQPPADRVFHDYEIFGTAGVSSPEKVAAIVASVLRGVENGPEEGMACFYPRHGVRAKLRDGRSIDLSICFHCMNMEIYVPGQPAERVYTINDAWPLLNEALQAAGVDLEQEVPSYLPPATLPHLAAGNP